MSNIAKTFKRLRKAGEKALIPYIMAGDPDLDATRTLVFDIEKAGADIIELGVPFSDPLADGPTIQRASERALAKGVTLRKVLSLVESIRERSDIPLILMTYYNPVFKFGLEEFAREAVRAGVDGVIVPDLIPDEAHAFVSHAKKHGLDTIFLLAPTSTEDRITKVARASSGFIYYVSITGITGSDLILDSSMKDTLSLIRKHSGKPVAVGFGISNAEQAQAVAGLADGIIVGSAIVKLVSEGGDIISFIRSLRKAV